MKLWGRTQPLSNYPIEECLAVLARVGFDGVEVCLENPDIAPALLTEARIKQVRERIHDLGLAPFSVSYHKDYTYDDNEFDLTKRAIRATRAFGADVFVMAGTKARATDAASAAEEWRRMLARFRELVAVAEENGVIIAEEFEPGFIVGTTEQLLRLFDEIPSPNLKANLDLGHVFLCDPDPLAAIAQVGSRIVHVHVENMQAGVHDHLLPQEGDMDLPAYLKALAQVGYDGCLTLDLYRQDYEAAAPEAIAYLRSILPA